MNRIIQKLKDKERKGRRLWEGGGDSQLEIVREREVRTTEQKAQKFSCASAGTAMPLWTSSVL